MLKLNQQTVRNMIDRGELGAVREGQRRVRVRQSQLDAFLSAGEMTHEPGGAAADDVDDEPWRGVREAADAVATAVQARIGRLLRRRCPPLQRLSAGCREAARLPLSMRRGSNRLPRLRVTRDRSRTTSATKLSLAGMTALSSRESCGSERRDPPNRRAWASGPRRRALSFSPRETPPSARHRNGDQAMTGSHRFAPAGTAWASESRDLQIANWSLEIADEPSPLIGVAPYPTGLVGILRERRSAGVALALLLVVLLERLKSLDPNDPPLANSTVPRTPC